MRKWFLILITVILFAFPPLATAQDQVVIETMDVSFWPEYDRADMLVIHHIMLAPDVALPALLDIRIPAAAGAPNAVAIGTSLDLVSDKNVKYTTKQQGDWLVVSIEVAEPAIQLEYYDPALRKDGNLRSYTYQWLSDYSVKIFFVTLQQPFDASGFKSSLTLQDDGIHPDALQYFTSNVGAVNAGEPFSFDISYEKPSDSFSVSQLQVQPVNPVSADTPGRVSFNNYLPYVIGGVGLALIVSGIIYYLQAGRAGAKKIRQRARGKSDDKESDSDVYCAQCGSRARSGDRFCRTCGSRIRQQED